MTAPAAVGDHGPGADAVAVVGMAARCGDAPDVAALWDLLCAGRSAVHRFTTEQLVAAGVDPAVPTDPDHVPAGTVVPGLDLFDAGFFGTTPAEATLTDPQHRVFLETVWTALEDAAVAPGAHDGRIGVWGSTSVSSYLLHHVLSRSEHAADPLATAVMVATDKDFLATRVAHRLDLRGPALTVQTACSSSLVAVHLACQSLLEGECEVAVAGGVSLLVPQGRGYRYRPGGILSRDGTCRPFDAAAGGTVKGDGCGVVVLRRLADALRDGDRVYAVIAGTAVNNDGAGKVGFTAPSPAGQTAVVRAALAFAGLTGADVDHVEAHGTGTALGDPVEVRALAAAYEDVAAGSVSLGSVKGALGHLDAAAGVTGLIAAVLTLHHQQVPPQVGFTRPNPALRLDTTPFAVHPEGREGPLRAAAVSSFGIGGTNAHAVLTAAPVPAPRPDPRGEYAVTVATRDADRLPDAVAALVAHLDAHPDLRVDDVARTLRRRRERMPHAVTVHASTAVGARNALAGLLTGGLTADPGPTQGPDGWPHARVVPLPGHPLRRERYWLDPVPGPHAQAASGGPVRAAQPVARPADLLPLVVDVLRRHLGLPGVGPDDDYAELGGDSFGAVEIVAELAQRTGTTLGLAEFQELGTARAIAARLAVPATSHPATPVSTASDRAVVVVREGPGVPRFLVHPAGGTTHCYTDLARHSRDRDPQYALGFPTSLLDAGLDTIEAVAEHHLERVRELRPHGPYRLGGYSFGGNVAVEMAVRLQAAGEEVSELLLIDAFPPSAYQDRDVPTERFLAAFPVVMDVVLGRPPRTDVPAPTTVEQAVALARRPTWSDWTAVEFARFLRVWMAHHKALERHRPSRRFVGDVVVLDAEEDLPGGIGELLGVRTVPKTDWAAHVDGRVQVVAAPGHHYSMVADPARLAPVYDAVVRSSVVRSSTA